MGKKKEEKEKIKVIHENLREVDVLEDFFPISKECRESYYYLQSLKTLFEEHLLITEDYNGDLIKDIRQRILEVESTYTSADEVATAEGDSVQDQFLPYSVNKLMRLPESIKILRLNIELKAKLDKLQIDILDYLMNLDISLIDKLEEKTPFLTGLVAQFKVGYLMESVFNRSTEEDRIVTYKFISKNNEIKKALKKLEEGLGEPAKIRDYTYLLRMRREQYKYCRQYSIDLMMKIPKFEEEQYLNNISKQQFIYNKRVTFLTYIMAFLTIVATITSIGQLYFASKGEAVSNKASLNQNSSVSVNRSIYNQVYEMETK